MKSLRSAGKRHGRARGGEIVVAALEERLVGQDRQAGGAACRVGAGQRGRVEVGADQPLAGRGLLDLGDQRDAGRRRAACAQRSREAARRLGRQGSRAGAASGSAALRRATCSRLTAQMRARTSLMRAAGRVGDLDQALERRMRGAAVDRLGRQTGALAQAAGPAGDEQGARRRRAPRRRARAP